MLQFMPHGLLPFLSVGPTLSFLSRTNPNCVSKMSFVLLALILHLVHDVRANSRDRQCQYQLRNNARRRWGHVRKRECGMSVGNAGVECEVVVVMLCEYRRSE